MSQSQSQTAFTMSIFTHKFNEMLDNLIADFDICFNKECLTIIYTSKCIHPYDSFESFDVKYIRTLHEYYEGAFDVHTDVTLVIEEHVHYRNKL